MNTDGCHICHPRDVARAPGPVELCRLCAATLPDSGGVCVVESGTGRGRRRFSYLVATLQGAVLVKEVLGSRRRTERPVRYWNPEARQEPRSSKSGRRAIARPPGSRLRAIAELMFSRHTFEHVFEPLVSDVQTEYIEAMADDRPWKMRAVRLRGVLSFLETVAVHSVGTLGRLVVRTVRLFFTS